MNLIKILFSCIIFFSIFVLADKEGATQETSFSQESSFLNKNSQILNSYFTYKKAKNYAKALEQLVKYEDLIKERSKTEGPCSYISEKFSRDKARLLIKLGKYKEALKEYNVYIDFYEHIPSKYSECDTVGEADDDFDDIVKERDEVKKLINSSK